MSDQLYNYMLSVSVPEDPLWERLCQETQDSFGFNMQISPEQAQFMTFLIRLGNVNNALEIGTFTGFSALTIARALPQSGRLLACDINTEWTDVAKRYWKQAGVAERIDLRIAPAIDTLNSLLEKGLHNTFDFAFIDADKGNYVAYFDSCLQLVRPGGVIAVDNTLWGGSVADPAKTDTDTKAIRELNQHIFENVNVVSSLVPIGDGLHLANKIR